MCLGALVIINLTIIMSLERGYTFNYLYNLIEYGNQFQSLIVQ